MRGTTREKIGALVGQRPAPHAENCFNCGGTTALGRLSVTRLGKKFVSCFRAECYEALKATLEDAHVAPN